MVALPPGGGRRTSTLGTGSGRATSVVVGRAGRGRTITNPNLLAVGNASGLATVVGVSDFELSGNAILLENGDNLLLETGDNLLLEDGASAGAVEGISNVRGAGSRLFDAVGTVSGAVAIVLGAMEEPNAADNLLLENGDDLLLEDGDFVLLESNGDHVLLEDGFSLLQEDGSLLLLESGAVSPPTAIRDTNGFEITDTNDEFILEV